MLNFILGQALKTYHRVRAAVNQIDRFYIIVPIILALIGFQQHLVYLADEGQKFIYTWHRWGNKALRVNSDWLNDAAYPLWQYYGGAVDEFLPVLICWAAYPKVNRPWARIIVIMLGFYQLYVTLDWLAVYNLTDQIWLIGFMGIVGLTSFIFVILTPLIEK